MADKVNELVCPNCGLRCFTPYAYTRCDGCGTVFYASQSAHVRSYLDASPYDLSTGDKGFQAIRQRGGR